VIRLLVVSDRGATFAARLGTEKRLQVFTLTAGLSPGEHLDEVQPDVVLLDLGSERVSDWLQHAATSRPAPAILVLADDMPGVLGGGWIRDSGRGVLPRHASIQEIVAAVEAVAAGLVVVHPDAGPLGGSSGRRRTPSSRTLTPREIEVLGMMAEGLGNKAIASRLGISLHTVKFHIASVFAKLNVESRTEAVTEGVRRGLVLI
jgi:NarL family two-component system response regulator YdfI